MTWRERIDEAEERGSFSETDLEAVSWWFSCAVGEQDSRVPRGRTPNMSFESANAPQDDKLMSLGVDCFHAIQDDHTANAREILGLIETRAAKILATLE